MSLVNILNVEVLDNPAPFFNPIQLEITFECIQALEDDLEWKVIYVGSASSEEYDQVLDSVMVGPVPVGINKFVFQTDPPNPAKIPAQDAIGATVLLLTCSYLSREFIRVGYYVNNDYTQEFLRPIHQAQLEQLQASGEQIDLANPPVVVYPAEPQFEHMVRSILADKPRVTRFPISWVKGQDTEMLEVPIVEGNPDEEPAEIEIRAGHVVSADGIQASSGSGVSPAAEQMIV